MVDDTEWVPSIVRKLDDLDIATAESVDAVDAKWQYCDNYIKWIDTLVKTEKVPVRKSRICVWEDEREMLEDNTWHLYVL